MQDEVLAFLERERKMQLDYINKIEMQNSGLISKDRHSRAVGVLVTICNLIETRKYGFHEYNVKKECD